MPTKSSIHFQRSTWFLGIATLFIDLYLYFGSRVGIIIVSSDSILPLILSVVAVNILLISPFFMKRDLISFYIVSYLLVNIVLLILFVRESTTFFFLIPATVLCLLFISSLKVEGKVTKFAALFLIIVLMDVLGKIFTLVLQPSPSPITVELLYDRTVLLGVPQPITEYYGLMLITRYGDAITGPFQFFLFLVTSSFVVENYHRIIRLLLRRSGGSIPISAGNAVIGAMGCQCESAIALFPAATILFLNILLIPFLLLGPFLLIATYILITRSYERQLQPLILKHSNMPTRFRTLLIEVIIILSQLLVVIGVVYHLQVSPFFIFGTGMAMIFNGFLIYYLVHRFFKSPKLGTLRAIFMLIASLAVFIIWFLPPLTSLAINNPLIFSSMSYSSLLSGFLISMIYFTSEPTYGKAMIDVYTVVVGVIPIIIYYFTFSTGKAIWSFWTISQQAELAVLLWIIMLPVMWYSTQKSLTVSLPEVKDVRGIL
jgi:hypothetical protein